MLLSFILDKEFTWFEKTWSEMESFYSVREIVCELAVHVCVCVCVCEC